MVKQLDYNTLREIFNRFKEAAKEPEGELEHVNVYTLVVAVALGNGNYQSINVNAVSYTHLTLPTTPYV